MKKTAFIVFVLMMGIAFFSCKKTSNPTPGPPVVKFLDFNVIKETDAYFHFGFTDPDGDIGLKDSDTTGDFAFGSPYHYDFHMFILNFDTNSQAFVPDTGTYMHQPYGIWNYRIPFIDNKSVDKSLTGEIYVEMTGYRPVSTVKRFKYQFYIYDRAHHKSNVITTPEFNYP